MVWTRYPDRMEHDAARRPILGAVIGFVLGAVFLALAGMAFFLGGGPFVAAIALVGGLATIAAGIVVLVRR